MKRVHRYDVPVDGLIHQVALQGPILHVATRRTWIVEFWVLDDDLVPAQTHFFEAIGTGQQVPDDAEWRGTAIAPDNMVWHLFELPADGA